MSGAGVHRPGHAQPDGGEFLRRHPRLGEEPLGAFEDARNIAIRVATGLRGTLGSREDLSRPRSQGQCELTSAQIDSEYDSQRGSPCGFDGSVGGCCHA